MSKNDRPIAQLFKAVFDGDKDAISKAWSDIEVTPADIAKSAHKWAIDNGFEYDEDSGWYTSKHMPPVDSDHVNGLYSLICDERVHARKTYLETLYMVGAIDRANFDFYNNVMLMVRDK
jgi:hypothetical protein